MRFSLGVQSRLTQGLTREAVFARSRVSMVWRVKDLQMPGNIDAPSRVIESAKLRDRTSILTRL